MANDDQLLREDDAAALVGVGPRTLQAWRNKGKGPPFVRISHRCVRYRRADLAEWVERHVRDPRHGDAEG